MASTSLRSIVRFQLYYWNSAFKRGAKEFLWHFLSHIQHRVTSILEVTNSNAIRIQRETNMGRRNIGFSERRRFFWRSSEFVLQGPLADQSASNSEPVKWQRHDLVIRFHREINLNTLSTDLSLRTGSSPLPDQDRISAKVDWPLLVDLDGFGLWISSIEEAWLAGRYAYDRDKSHSEPAASGINSKPSIR